VTVLGLRRLESLAAVLDKKGAPRPVFLARVIGALLLGREGLVARTWRGRGLDVERGVAIALGARQSDGLWPAAMAIAAADPPVVRRWLGEEGLAAVVDDGIVLVGPPEAAALARAWLLGDWPEAALARLDSPLGVGEKIGDLTAVLSAAGEVQATARLPGLPPSDALAGLLGTAVVRASQVRGIGAKDHVLVARSELCVAALPAGAPVMTAARDVKAHAATGDARKLSAVLGVVPWPSPWHAHPLLRILKVE